MKATMTSELAKRECTPCEKKQPPLEPQAIATLSQQLNAGWTVANQHHLEKEYTFDDFRGALEFTKRVGEVAEKENHHPDIFLAWGKVRLKIWTHNIDGLSENDFILAAKADEVQ